MSETRPQHCRIDATRVHHIGMSVASLDAALEFWEAFLGKPARWRTVLDRPYLGRHRRLSRRAIDAAFVDLPGGVVIELLDYQVDGRVPNTDATANPGNVHLCLTVDDARCGLGAGGGAAARGRSSPDGPVDIDGGPNMGARAAYLRIHDGITLELFQPRAGAKAGMIKRISFVRRKDGHEPGGILRPLDGPACRHRAAVARRPRPALRRGPELDARRRPAGTGSASLVRQHRGRR